MNEASAPPPPPQPRSIPLGLYSLSGKTSYCKISWSLDAARIGFKLFQSLWNLAGTSAALLLRCLSNFRAIRPLQHPISRLRDFTRFGGKTSYRLVNKGPGIHVAHAVVSRLHEKPLSALYIQQEVKCQELSWQLLGYWGSWEYMGESTIIWNRDTMLWDRSYFIINRDNTLLVP